MKALLADKGATTKSGPHGDRHGTLVFVDEHSRATVCRAVTAQDERHSSVLLTREALASPWQSASAGPSRDIMLAQGAVLYRLRAAVAGLVIVL